MSKTDSGIKSPSRFFGFRWAYVLLAAVLWAFLLPLIWIEADHDALWTPGFLLFNLIAETSLDASWLRLQGVFGLNLYDYSYGTWSSGGYWVDPMFAAAVLATLLLIGSILAFIIPERGQAKSLPATRGIHLRGKLATALVIGMALTAMTAGFFDLADIDLKPTFNELGWLTASSTGWGYGWQMLTYYPDAGIAKPVSWIGTCAGVFVFGLLVWLLTTFVRPGRDRYWHAERWTLIFTLFGLALCIAGLFGMRDDAWAYSELELFLGGCYTTFIIGLFTLTWAWTCRTAMFMMMRRYEKEAIDSDEPICFACGYDLRMLGSDKCPECGTQVHPEVLVKIRAQAETHAESRSTTR